MEVTKMKVADIVVDRPQRQREKITGAGELAFSIERNGLINPITVTHEGKLIAGERRLQACKKLGWEEIPVRIYENLSEIDQQLIELEENMKRSQLDWADEVKSVRRIHELLSSANPDWSVAKTAHHIGYSTSYIYRVLDVAADIAAGNEKVLNATSLTTATNIIAKKKKRALDSEINKLVSNIASDVADEQDAPTLQVEQKPDISILNADFREFAPTYSGSRFNLIHCDFPYGINYQNSAQGGSTAQESYADTADIYWELCDTLCKNLPRLLLPRAHIVFWFSMKFYTETIEFFKQNVPSQFKFKIMPQPLVWLKSDGKGIVSDSDLYPRNVYEVALFMSFGDKTINTPVWNAHAAPTLRADSFHLSEKPEPMLRHFFKMLCDENTELLDPTCGSGSAIRAAIDYKVKRALGLEVIEDFATAANTALTKKINLAKLSKGVSK